jgi:hypothetical protein
MNRSWGTEEPRSFQPLIILLGYSREGGPVASVGLLVACFMCREVQPPGTAQPDGRINDKEHLPVNEACMHYQKPGRQPHSFDWLASSPYRPAPPCLAVL